MTWWGSADAYVPRDFKHSDHLPLVADYDVKSEEPPIAPSGTPVALLGISAR